MRLRDLERCRELGFAIVCCWNVERDGLLDERHGEERAVEELEFAAGFAVGEAGVDEGVEEDLVADGNLWGAG